MATIRIYKVAEVLGIPSQEVIDLLKREHGIEAKSASSTIEEIVARQFHLDFLAYRWALFHRNDFGPNPGDSGNGLPIQVLDLESIFGPIPAIGHLHKYCAD